MTTVFYLLLAAALGCYIAMIGAIAISGWLEGLKTPKKQTRPRGGPALDRRHRLDAGRAPPPH